MGHLFDQITSLQTLYRAFDKVEDNHGCPGADAVTIEDFGVYLEENLARLKADLISGAYRPLPLLRVYIEKSNGKKRPLSIPAVRDRVAQTAAALILTPILDPQMEDISYAYREGRSVDQAVRRIMSLQRLGYHWVVDADIRAYFDEIPHNAMMDALRRHVDDEATLNLIHLWLAAEVVYKNKKYALRKGVPQGSPVSPLLANLYLDSFDEAHIRHGHKLVRFADDFVILCKTKPAAQAALELTEQELGKLRLALNMDKTRITNFDQGFRYLGVQFLRSMAYKPTVADEEAPPPPTESPRSAGTAAPARPAPETALAIALKEALTLLPPEEAKRKWESFIAGAESETQDEELPPASGHDPILRTLYLMEQGAEISKEDDRFIVRKDGATLSAVPALKVDQIMIFGNIRLTTPAIRFCLTEDIPVFLLSSRGQYYGVIESTKTDKVELHRDQFTRAADPAFMLSVAKQIVKGKITNSRVVLMRWRRKTKNESLNATARSLHAMLPHVDKAATLDELRGVEGTAAALYFGAWPSLLDKQWGFTGRKKRPPTDPVNSLLSYGYTLLFYNAYSMVRSRGLHPYVGVFHSMRQGHPALVSDLIEEFRALVVDSTVMALITGGKVTPGDFTLPTEPGAPCVIGDTARKTITRAFEAAMNRPITHPDAAAARMDYRRAIALQAEKIARIVMGAAPAYKPFISR